MSAAGVTGDPVNCSGAIQAGVPTTIPALVMPAEASSRAWAMPKSITRGPK
jgi:hypothetical protein